MNIALYVLAGLDVLGALAGIAQTGKPRRARTPGDAVALVIMSAVTVTILVLAAGRLG